ncbi:glycosyltransferase family 2 protein [Ornithobacterium rhinotracheale]|uniref:glycosyltransferase n=1 Tax=Ornithobacterium rhinotracheale TaxID=28251 RepID=UPI00129C2168|nr:glycosyltransferase family 2 protein [Ornithobacterium rhinotracheale]MRJ08786.1 glycosyltransferase family 2 protein [Ornithobacterium rhinotracheale]UOH77070.1 glycosyltransferase family 2 protein [Ornithobacterium rhinotracheale]
MKTAPKVCSIIVTYNAERWIVDCLSTLREPHLDMAILLIDNGSTDATLEIVRRQFPQVQIIETGENLGFARANNLGYEHAKKLGADYLYLLNQDTKSYPNTVFNLVQMAEKYPDFAILSPLHLNEKGDAFDSKFEAYIDAKKCPNYISDASLGTLKEIYTIDFVNAAAWLVAVSALEKTHGLFSEVFYHYGEDRNFVQRVQYFGVKVGIVPSLKIHHCRDERSGAFSPVFERKKLKIKSLVLMHNINQSYGQCTFDVWKEALMQWVKLNIWQGLKLFFYPIFSAPKILSARRKMR